MVRHLVFRALVVAASLLAASSATLAQPTNLTTIRFIAPISDDLLPFWYAQTNGLFRAAGLNVVVTTVATGTIATQAIVTGAADVGRTSPSVLIAAHVRGIPFVIVAPGAVHRRDAPGG